MALSSSEAKTFETKRQVACETHLILSAYTWLDQNKTAWHGAHSVLHYSKYPIWAG
jgi:hypothetical protein